LRIFYDFDRTAAGLQGEDLMGDQLIALLKILLHEMKVIPIFLLFTEHSGKSVARTAIWYCRIRASYYILLAQLHV